MAKRLLLLVGLLALILLSAAAGLASGFLLGQARAAPPGRPGEGAALLGVAAFSDAGGPHWELRAPARLDPAPAKRSLSVRRWLLLLPADPSAKEARPRDGWLCLVRGRVSGEPNPWGLPAVEAERVVPLAPASWALRRAAPPAAARIAGLCWAPCSTRRCIRFPARPTAREGLKLPGRSSL